MARPHTPPAMRRRSGGSFLLGMFVGVLIGLAISLVIAFYLNKGPMPFITAKPKQAEKDATSKSGPVAGLPQGTPAATPEKPKFDFYKILPGQEEDRKSTRLNSSHTVISYAVFCLKKKTNSTLPSS